ncbi:MAG: hypothetical protein HYS12_15325 [Planctomycetes bacterium]|nr:hypothetical protein [Planctomycetota bacterium]
MWPWIKRWRDWVMNDLLPTYRIGAQPRALHFSFEKAGLVLHDQPIPWNAEAVLVEATMRLPSPSMRRKQDFQLAVPGQDPRPADALRKQETTLPDEHRHSIFFRLVPPATAVPVELLWRGRSQGRLDLPVLTRDEFFSNLRLQMPTLSVCLGEESVACQTFVSTQCKGLLASAVLTSPTSLVPLADMDFHVEFKSERSGSATSVPVRLSSTQLTGRQALLTVAPHKHPRRLGTWTATWLLGNHELATQRVRGISRQQFHRSLRVCDTRFVLQGDNGAVVLARQLPATDPGHPRERVARVGPCFLVASSEPGMAGLAPLRVTAQVPGAVQPPLLLEQDVLITDGPTMVAPGTLDPADLAQVSGFDLALKGRSLCLLPLCPAPAAAFNSEGAFKPPPEYTWSLAADEELNERLSRLLEEKFKQE